MEYNDDEIQGRRKIMLDLLLSILTYVFVYGVLFGLPIAAEAFLGISIFRFISAKVKNKRVPYSYTDKQIKTRLILLIASAAIFLTLMAVIIGFIILLFSSIAYM